MPWKSEQQRKWGNSPAGRSALGVSGVAEWNRATKGMKLPQRKADGGEVNEWDEIPRTAEGRPQITVTKPTPYEGLGRGAYDTVTGLARNAYDYLSGPSPIKPATPPQAEVQNPSETLGGLGSSYIQSLKDLADPHVKEEEQEAYRNQPVAPAASRDGKIPENQKDPFSLGVPVAAEVAGTFAGTPGTGAGWAALKAAGYGISQAAIAFGAGVAKQSPKFAGGLAAKIAAQHGYLDTTKFTKVGHQLGYMPGGVYKDPSGVPYYLKFGPDIEQIKNENLTAKLYQLAGTPAAEVSLTHIGGKPGIASKLLQNSHQLSEAKIPYNQIEGLHDNFVVDAWLANHDAVGTGHENPLGNIMIQDGKAIRIDGGGALRYKGSGQIKNHFNDEADEIFSMRDPNFSKRSAQVFGDISDESLKIGAQKVANVDMKKLAELIAKYGPSDEKDQLSLIGKLAKRRQYIMDHFGVKPQSADPGFPSPVSTPRPSATNPEKPLTDADWAQIESDADFFGHGGFEQANYHLDLPAPVSDFIPEGLSYENVFKGLSGKKDLVSLKNGISLSKPHMAVAINQLLSGPPHKKTWLAAYQLWDMAENLHPQTAEALFRNLPPKIQIDVGKRISALSKELGYTPFKVKKGSGAGVSPYDYYTTKTANFKADDDFMIKNASEIWDIKDLLKNKSMGKPQESVESAVKTAEKDIEKVSPIADDIADDPYFLNQYSPIKGGWANSVKNAPKEANKLLNTFIFQKAGGADIEGMASALNKIMEDTPSYGDKVYDNLSYALAQSHFDTLTKNLLKVSNKEPERLRSAYKAADEWKKSLSLPPPKKSPLDEFNEVQAKEDMAGKDNHRAWTLFDNPERNGSKISEHFDKVTVPIKNWTEWLPREGGAAKSAKLENITPQQAKALGFNPNVTLYHGSKSKKSELIDPGEKKDFETALFAHHQSSPANKYSFGAMLDFVAKAPKAIEVNWPHWAGGHRYGQTAKAMEPLIMEARKRGIDLIVAHNIYDVGGLNTQYLFLTPHKGTIRSLIAKFDPAKLHTGLVNSSLVGGAALTYGAVSSGKGGDKMNRGGIPSLVVRAKTLARGGPGSAPWQSRAGSHPRHKPGMIKSSIPGRTDKIPMSVPPGSYILPSDIASALGEGNTAAGEKILGAMFNQGPYSPKASAFAGRQPGARIRRFAEGGAADSGEDIPIIAAGGEYVLHPDQVLAVGNGNMKAGHAALDKFVLKVRKEHIKTLRSLPPPKK